MPALQWSFSTSHCSKPSTLPRTSPSAWRTPPSHARAVEVPYPRGLRDLRTAARSGPASWVTSPRASVREWRSSAAFCRIHKFLIMDEPTSVLTPQEVDILFETLQEALRRGHRDPLYLPQARGNPRALRPRHDPQARQGRGQRDPARTDSARTGRDDGGRRAEGPRTGPPPQGRGPADGQRPFHALGQPLRHRAQGHLVRRAGG